MCARVSRTKAKLYSEDICDPKLPKIALHLLSLPGKAVLLLQHIQKQSTNICTFKRFFLEQLFFLFFFFSFNCRYCLVTVKGEQLMIWPVTPSMRIHLCASQVHLLFSSGPWACLCVLIVRTRLPPTSHSNTASTSQRLAPF